jgi:RNA polymerase sigma-70 factor (ECF subfamily)
LLVASEISDEAIVERIRAGETGLYELLMRRYNQRLYRVARSVLGDDAEAEDVMQEAYVRAYEHLGQFAGRSKFATWLTKIAVYEALARRRRRSRTGELDMMHSEHSDDRTFASGERDPERQVLDGELRRKLDEAMDKLPQQYRTVVVMRDVEQMSTSEAAAALGISALAVKIRLHRARAALRRTLAEEFGGLAASAYAFHAPRCDRVVSGVLARIGVPPRP